MAQRHLYGPNYIEKTPPTEWQQLQLSATVYDSSVSANIVNLDFTFVGTAADYLLDEWVPTYGVFCGCPYRIEITQGTETVVAFDGFIVLSEYLLNSKINPRILVCPVRELNNNITVFDKVSILTQGLLKQKGAILNSDFKDVPLVFASKEGAKDRAVALSNLAFQVVTFYTNAVQNFLSAISDILGLSAAIGLVELLSLFINLVLEINQIIDLIEQSRSLLLASQSWYKAISLKTILVKAFQYEGYSVEFGEIDEVLSKTYIKSSENGFGGIPFPGSNFANGIKRQDYGYLVSEIMQTVKLLHNTREVTIGNVVHIKKNTDPFWTDSPDFTPSDVLVETSAQEDNGFFRNKTEEIFSTVRIAYQYDPSDTWTLTENNGDSYEVHRESISDPNPKMNTLKGLLDIQIPFAMGVRYDSVETLADTFEQVLDAFNLGIGDIQGVIDQFSSFIDSAAGADTQVAEVLALSPINFIYAISSGGLKVEDDTFGIPKLFYADTTDANTLNIPENFKDYIGGEAIYNGAYLPDSPAIENNFAGQYTAIEDLEIPFLLTSYNLTKNNPFFVLNSNPSKFEHINWTENDNQAEVDIESNQVFDTNIKEIIIE